MTSILRFLVFTMCMCAAPPLGYSSPDSGAAVSAAGSPGPSCTAPADIVLGARTPEVDLFDTPSGGTPVLTMTKADFPACLPVLEQSPSKMLKVHINGKDYWVQPHTVRYHIAGDKMTTCRRLTTNSDDTKTGTTRGFGNGC